jgi:hypothetical protein
MLLIRAYSCRDGWRVGVVVVVVGGGGGGGGVVGLLLLLLLDSDSDSDSNCCDAHIPPLLLFCAA